MADEKETQAAPAAPAFDMNAMADRLAQAAAAGTQQAIERVAARNQQQQQAAEQQRQTQADPVASTILNTVAPLLQKVAVKGDHGRDAAIFYATNPAAAKFSGVIEGRVNELSARNIEVDRHSVWNLIKGEQGLNADGLTFDQALERREAEVKAAREAETIRGSRGGAPAPILRDPTSMSAEELEKAMENVAF